MVAGTAVKLVEFDDVFMPPDDINGGKPAPAIIPPLDELPSTVVLRMGMLGAEFQKSIKALIRFEFKYHSREYYKYRIMSSYAITT